MGNRPSDTHSLDRINNDDGYYKENCRWATRIQQENNKSTNLNISYKDEIKTLKEWSRKLGINYHTLFGRLNRGWSVAKAFGTPVRKRKR